MNKAPPEPATGDRTRLTVALTYTFDDPALLETALAHPSHAHEVDGSRGNERLEFLGDAVLGLAVAHLLYDAHPDWPEGELTRARASLVNKSALAAVARQLDLGAHVMLGRTERLSGGEEKDSILANCFEAVLGAVYLDGGLGAVIALTGRVFGELVSEESDAVRRDPKTAFQEWTHAEFHRTPRYQTIRDSETENDEERFTVEVFIGDRVLGAGTGRSKRAAELAAAEAALASEADGDV